jgi:hypothetical protein
MKLLVTQFSPSCSNVGSLRSKYATHHPVREDLVPLEQSFPTRLNTIREVRMGTAEGIWV